MEGRFFSSGFDLFYIPALWRHKESVCWELRALKTSERRAAAGYKYLGAALHSVFNSISQEEPGLRQHLPFFSSLLAASQLIVKEIAFSAVPAQQTDEQTFANLISQKFFILNNL